MNPGRIIKNENSSNISRTPAGEDIDNILSQMDKMLDLYDKILDIIVPPRVTISSDVKIDPDMYKNLHNAVESMI